MSVETPNYNIHAKMTKTMLALHESKENFESLYHDILEFDQLESTHELYTPATVPFFLDVFETALHNFLVELVEFITIYAVYRSLHQEKEVGEITEEAQNVTELYHNLLMVVYLDSNGHFVCPIDGKELAPIDFLPDEQRQYYFSVSFLITRIKYLKFFEIIRFYQCIA